MSSSRLFSFTFSLLIPELLFWIGFLVFRGLVGGMLLLAAYAFAELITRYRSEHLGVSDSLYLAIMLEDLDENGSLAARFINPSELPSDTAEERELRRWLRVILAARAGIQPPALWLVDKRDASFLFAATVARSPRSLLLVTRELAWRPEPEVLAVLAHEMAHCAMPHSRARVLTNFGSLALSLAAFGALVAVSPVFLLIPKGLPGRLGVLGARLAALHRWEIEADRSIRRFGADPLVLARMLEVETKQVGLDRSARWLMARRFEAFHQDSPAISVGSAAHPAEVVPEAKTGSEAP